MTLDLTDIQKTLENLHNLVEVMQTKNVRQENHALYLNAIIRDLSARLHTTTDFKEKLETENRILKRKLRRLQNEHLSSLRQ